jgi:hypothetical protein
MKRINICSQRLNALINNQDFDVPKDAKVTIKPKFCDINYDKTSETSRKLSDEPGIPELEKLYYNEYNYDQGGFTGMTDKMRKKVYEKDVEAFYKTFTGNSKLPVDANGVQTIKTFSQIPLRDFHRSKGCEKNGAFTKGHSGTLKDKLFKQYAEHIKKMMVTTEKNQNKLLSIIDKMFVFSINPETKLKEVVINPKMDEKALQEIVETTRKLIIELYLKCENDFLEGLEIFEAIVEKQILDTSKEQIKELETTIENTLESPVAPDTVTLEVDEKVPDMTPPLVEEEIIMAPSIIAPNKTEAALDDDYEKILAPPVIPPPENNMYDEKETERQAEDAEMKELAVRLNALGGGSPKGVIVGGTRYI